MTGQPDCSDRAGRLACAYKRSCSCDCASSFLQKALRASRHRDERMTITCAPTSAASTLQENVYQSKGKLLLSMVRSIPLWSTPELMLCPAPGPRPHRSADAYSRVPPGLVIKYADAISFLGGARSLQDSSPPCGPAP